MATAPPVATLRARLDGVSIVDRHHLQRRLRGLSRLSGRRAEEARVQITKDIIAAENSEKQK
jgi:hypothetical protein